MCGPLLCTVINTAADTTSDSAAAAADVHIDPAADVPSPSDNTAAALFLKRLGVVPPIPEKGAAYSPSEACMILGTNTKPKSDLRGK